MKNRPTSPASAHYKIKLSDVPEEGRSYSFNQNTGEISADLADLIGSNPYAADLFLRPLNAKDFELTGTIKTATKEDCSLCGEDFSLAANLKIHEILIPSTQRPSEKSDKSGRHTKPNHVSDLELEGPGVTEYANDEFEIGECLRQAIALSVPFNPRPPVNSKGDCSVCLKRQPAESFAYDEKMGSEEKVSPFAVLKNVKIN